MRRGLIVALAALSLLAHQRAAGQSNGPRFADVTEQAGVSFRHVSTPEKRYIVESMSGGAALLDCDADGVLDVATVNGQT